MTFFSLQNENGKRAPFLFLNRNDIWVLALYVSRFRLVLSTWEEICVEGHAFRSWAIWQEPEDLTGLQATCQRALHLHTPSLQPWLKNQQFKFSSKAISFWVPWSTLVLPIRNQSQSREKSKHNSMKGESKKRKGKRERRKEGRSRK